MWKNRRRVQHLLEKLTRRWRRCMRGAKITYICMETNKRKMNIMGRVHQHPSISSVLWGDPSGHRDIGWEYKHTSASCPRHWWGGHWWHITSACWGNQTLKVCLPASLLPSFLPSLPTCGWASVCLHGSCILFKFACGLHPQLDDIFVT